jgi:hypothetical protein
MLQRIHQDRKMLSEIELLEDVDVMAMSPLLRCMVMAIAYADAEGGIGLITSGAMNRQFMHWAAVHFDWPDYRAQDAVNKALNEPDLPPLWVVSDMLKRLRLLRRRKDVLVPTQRGREFTARPRAFFDLIATEYLCAYIYDWQTQNEVRERIRWWPIFLNAINVRARSGCSLRDLMSELYAAEIEMTIDAWTTESELRYNIIRPLCWLGLLREDRVGLSILLDDKYYKTQLWAACLGLESDTQTEITVP